MLDLIEKTTGQIEVILNQLGQLLENSKKELTVEAVDIRDVIEEIRNEFQGELKKRSMEVSVRVHNKHILFTDLERLKTILFQFFSNAVTYHNPKK